MAREAFALLLLSMSVVSAGASNPYLAEACGGVSVYIYRDLPTAFPDAEGRELLSISLEESATTAAKTELGVPCEADVSHACSAVLHWGRGAQVQGDGIPAALANTTLEFHVTLQNAMPWMVAGHLMAYCAVPDPADAQLFFVTYPVVSLHRAYQRRALKHRAKDANYVAVKAHLAQQPAWRRCNGCDHFLSIEAPILLYRRRRALLEGGYYHEDCFWLDTMRLSHHAPELAGGDHGITGTPPRPAVQLGFPMQAVAVPWPLNFQPRSDADVEAWLAYAFAATPARDPRAVLMVATRRHRRRLMSLCDEVSTPCVLRGSKGLQLFFSAYRDYTFAIQPGGDTPTRRGFFDALIAGCIPVVFTPTARVAGGLRHAGRNDDPWIHYRLLYSRYFEAVDGWGEGWLERVALVAGDEEHAMRLIRETSQERIAEMRENIRRIIPHLLFWDHTAPREKSKYRSQSIVPRMLSMLAENVAASNVTKSPLPGEETAPRWDCESVVATDPLRPSAAAGRYRRRVL